MGQRSPQSGDHSKDEWIDWTRLIPEPYQWFSWIFLLLVFWIRAMLLEVWIYSFVFWKPCCSFSTWMNEQRQKPWSIGGSTLPGTLLGDDQQRESPDEQSAKALVPTRRFSTLWSKGFAFEISPNWGACWHDTHHEASFIIDRHELSSMKSSRYHHKPVSKCIKHLINHITIDSWAINKPHVSLL